ncbi:hypothetical protein Aph02nite_04220 [Actinoplanes philippinensis]|uniref:Ricin-type beta-trefoil lectin domain-containing protein n=2 Tax=Actinoplanes philippinensis TaxID=35752 RepID=A0A1I2D4Z2_9ACTN|nr:hypothetical protein Aph02nite_04220 [Actinoplanes philippinensis]SFE75574.1 Ricin-type beta-trefoil lectin domain-containing protein [Actinoplanes philippinensis]
MILAVLSGILGLSATPASAIEANMTWVSMGTNRCLDSNANQYAYTRGCGQPNLYQRWNGAFPRPRIFRNVATNLCLDSNAAREVYTRPCGAGNQYQQWRDISTTSSYGVFQNVATGYCLDGNASGDLYTNGCNMANRYMRWREVYP